MDRGETSHTAELENEDELDEDEDAWSVQENSGDTLGAVAVGTSKFIKYQETHWAYSHFRHLVIPCDRYNLFSEVERTRGLGVE